MDAFPSANTPTPSSPAVVILTSLRVELLSVRVPPVSAAARHMFWVLLVLGVRSIVAPVAVTLLPEPDAKLETRGWGYTASLENGYRRRSTRAGSSNRSCRL